MILESVVLVCFLRAWTLVVNWVKMMMLSYAWGFLT